MLLFHSKYAFALLLYLTHIASDLSKQYAPVLLLHILYTHHSTHTASMCYYSTYTSLLCYYSADTVFLCYYSTHRTLLYYHATRMASVSLLYRHFTPMLLLYRHYIPLLLLYKPCGQMCIHLLQSQHAPVPTVLILWSYVFTLFHTNLVVTGGRLPQHDGTAPAVSWSKAPPQNAPHTSLSADLSVTLSVSYRLVCKWQFECSPLCSLSKTEWC